MAVSGLLPRFRHIACALALTVAGAVWIGAVREHPPLRGRDLVERLDPSFALLRQSLPDDARVGLLLPAGPFSSDAVAELYFAAQYSLAPLLVRPVVAGDCASRGTRACGAEELDFFIAQSTEQAVAAALDGPLGLRPVAVANGLFLSRRGP
jgi:hypothetical protein